MPGDEQPMELEGEGPTGAEGRDATPSASGERGQEWVSQPRSGSWQNSLSEDEEEEEMCQSLAVS